MVAVISIRVAGMDTMVMGWEVFDSAVADHIGLEGELVATVAAFNFRRGWPLKESALKESVTSSTMDFPDK